MSLLRVRQAAQPPGCDALKIARIIQTVPVLAVKRVKVANGLLPPAGRRRCSSVRRPPQSVLSYTLRNLFKTASPLLRERMINRWAHSAHLGTLAYLLAGGARGVNVTAEHGAPCGLCGPHSHRPAPGR